jgi:hypothetical protein
MSEMSAIFSVDVEYPELGAAEGTTRFMRMCDQLGIRATFFMTGEVLTQAPELARMIVEEGHELASHGSRHPKPGEALLRDMHLEEASVEIQRSRDIFEEQGFLIEGFRAPVFGINPDVLRMVASSFLYDSSLTPKTARLYNMEQSAHRLYGMYEFPIAEIWPIGVPAGSSVLMGLGQYLAAMLSARCLSGKPLVLYAHSYDLVDADFSSLGTKIWKRAWYYNRCSPNRANFFSAIINGLMSRSTRFVSFSEYRKSFISVLDDSVSVSDMAE